MHDDSTLIWSDVVIWAIGIAAVSILLFLIIYAIRNAIIEKQKQRMDFLNATSQDQYITERFNALFSTILYKKAEAEWNAAGKNPRKQNGGYRVDFERALQQKQQNMRNLGVTSQSVLNYIHQRGENPPNKDVDNMISMAIDGVIRNSKEQLSHSFSTEGITPSEFFLQKSVMSGDSVGVYVILNQTKSKYYVGQAKRLYFRVNQHFTGHGNGDVYADYKYGDQFLIKLITLRESGYDDLDKLERDMIQQYHANGDTSIKKECNINYGFAGSRRGRASECRKIDFIQQACRAAALDCRGHARRNKRPHLRKGGVVRQKLHGCGHRRHRAENR